MYILGSILSKISKAASPYMLRYGLKARAAIGSANQPDFFFLDALCLLPLTQKLISIEAADDIVKLRKTLEASQKGWEGGDGFVDRNVNKVFDRLFPLKEMDKVRAAAKLEKEGGRVSRLEILEGYVKPALLPTGTWKDCHSWRYNVRFVKWLRKEVLLAQHDETVRMSLLRYPALRFYKKRRGVAALLYNQGKDDSLSRRKKLLPKSSEVVRAFGMQKWSRVPNKEAELSARRQIVKSLGGTMQGPSSGLTHTVHEADLEPSLSNECSVDHLPLDELLELSGGHVALCGALNAYCEVASMNEVFTAEYVDALSSYLLDRAQSLQNTSLQPSSSSKVTVLEMGAGDGLLSHHIRACMRRKRSAQNQQSYHYRHGPSARQKPQRSPGGQKQHENLPRVVAIDNQSWDIDPQSHVQIMDYKEALQTYVTNNNTPHHDTTKQAPPGQDSVEHHVIVLCSWMPMGVDWTADFRSHQVAEYILIGECDDGSCGHNWSTWGNAAFYEFAAVENDEERRIQEGEVPPPPYVVDGYERVDLTALAKMQYSRFDSRVSRSSSTVSFRRLKS